AGNSGANWPFHIIQGNQVSTDYVPTDDRPGGSFQHSICHDNCLAWFKDNGIINRWIVGVDRAFGVELGCAAPFPGPLNNQRAEMSISPRGAIGAILGIPVISLPTFRGADDDFELQG